MSWIKLREDLEDDPAVAFIAKRCGVTGGHVVGKLARAWSWAGRLSEDGKVPLATPELLDKITDTPGFASAMEAAGWLEVGSSHLLFPKWDRHNSEGAKSRLLTAERVRRHRATRERGEPVTEPRYQRRGEERRRGENPPTPLRGKPAAPAEREETPAVGSESPAAEGLEPERKASPAKPRAKKRQVADVERELVGAEPWIGDCARSWVAYRTEKGLDAYAPLGFRALVNEMRELGEPRVRAAMRFSMGSNYQGLIEPKNGHKAATEREPPPLPDGPTFWAAERAKFEALNREQEREQVQTRGEVA